MAAQSVIMRRMVSLHEIHAVEFVLRSSGWFTSLDLARATNMARRTAQLHLRRLTALGVVDKRTVFGGCRYRRRMDPTDMRAREYVRRVEQAKEAFEVERSALGMAWVTMGRRLRQRWRGQLRFA